MKKTFFNISTGGGDLQTSTKTKRKFLKTFSFTSLALLMGAAGVFAFAPLVARPNLANTSEAIETTTEQGLITPKADDPVIYTTESGLEIKWGNALPSSANNYLTSGNLKGFPYFTTTNGSTTYTWVIIGKNPSLDLHSKIDSSSLFSTWKTNNSFLTNSNYFFNNTFESTTPAGSAINSVVPSKSYIADYSKLITSNSEIPSGCVLTISNSTVGSSAYYSGATTCTSAAHTFAGANNTLRATCANYYTNDTFGFGSYLSSLQNITLSQICVYGTSGVTTATTSLYFFPLDICELDPNNPNASSYPSEFGSGDTSPTLFTVSDYLSTANFKSETYLTEAQRGSSNYVQGRTMMSQYHQYLYDSKGNVQVSHGSGYDANKAWLVRPSCVIKI